MALGADGIQVGTRFICSNECIAHENYKEAVIKAKDRDAVVTGRSTGAPVRALKNKLTREYAKLESSGAAKEEIENLKAENAELKKNVETIKVENEELKKEIATLRTQLADAQERTSLPFRWSSAGRGAALAWRCGGGAISPLRQAWDRLRKLSWVCAPSGGPLPDLAMASSPSSWGLPPGKIQGVRF